MHLTEEEEEEEEEKATGDGEFALDLDCSLWGSFGLALKCLYDISSSVNDIH